MLCLSCATKAPARDTWVKVKNGIWEPTQQILLELKTNFQPKVTRMAQPQKLLEFDKYIFQYRGDTENGRLFIFVNAACDAHNIKLDEEMVDVDDGGVCYFNIKYDPVKKQLYGLWINGNG